MEAIYCIFRRWRGNPSHIRFIGTTTAASQAEAEAQYVESDPNYFIEGMVPAVAKDYMTYSEMETAGII